jgi:galactose mutarotase-like enzyme
VCPDVEIAGGGARAVVTERGAGLRAFEVDGVPYCETSPADQEPPMGVGAVLIPWPNRVAAGRWGWRGEAHQLAITEPERGHAIHGLLRHALWRVVRAAALPATTTWCATSCGRPTGRASSCGPIELWADPAFGWVQVFTPHDFPRTGRGSGRAVAVEPMTCPPDALDSHVDVTVLGPRQSWAVRWGLRALAPQ